MWLHREKEQRSSDPLPEVHLQGPEMGVGFNWKGGGSASLSSPGQAVGLPITCLGSSHIQGCSATCKSLSKR